MPSPRNGAVGEFRFGGGQVPRGAYRFTVTEGLRGEYLLQPNEWINKPWGFSMVPAQVRITSGGLEGLINARGCGRISARVAGFIAPPPPPPPPVPAPPSITAQLREVLRQDALSWNSNKLDQNSAGTAMRDPRAANTPTYRLPYSYNRGKPGWIAGRFDASGRLTCVEFHDYLGTCRAPRSEAEFQAAERKRREIELTHARDADEAAIAAGRKPYPGLKFVLLSAPSWKITPAGCLDQASGDIEKVRVEVRNGRREVVKDYGEFINTTTDLVRNHCKTRVTYSRHGETHTLPAGGVHIWRCYFGRDENVFGQLVSYAKGCYKD